MSKIYRCEKNHLLDYLDLIDADGKKLCPHDNTKCRLEADTDDRQRIAELEKQNAELLLENEQLKKQEFAGMDCTIDQMLSIDMQGKWGLDKQEHGRNIQLMFVRAVDAINELEAECNQLKSEKERLENTIKTIDINWSNAGSLVHILEAENKRLKADNDDLYTELNERNTLVAFIEDNREDIGMLIDEFYSEGEKYKHWRDGIK